jgi:hypothetical protein
MRCGYRKPAVFTSSEYIRGAGLPVKSASNRQRTDVTYCFSSKCSDYCRPTIWLSLRVYGRFLCQRNIGGEIELKFHLVIVQRLRMRGAVLHGHNISSQRVAKLSTGKIITLLIEDYSPILMHIITFQYFITILSSSPKPKAFSRWVMSFRSSSKSQSWRYIDPKLWGPLN